MPRTLGAYIAFARSLPSQFDDHAWLAESADGTPVAAGYCWSNSTGDRRVMECDVLVAADQRRRGTGSRLLREICDATAGEGRSLLTWSTFGAVPAGESFSWRVGGRVARVNRTSELTLADVDWTLVQDWAHPDRGNRRGYWVEMVDGTFSGRLRADAVTFHRIMQSAPREQLDIGDVVVDAGFVAELDRALLQAGRSRWTVLVRDPSGQCVGGTEIVFDPSVPGTVLQQNTGIDPAHRGRGLAKWVKAVMLERIRRERPDAGRVRTDNAMSNGPMLAINHALGFRIIATRTEWQADVSAVLRALG